ncbi:MAG: tyrosine-type recombinase/integrase [Rhodospirillales bacterium]|nr:tyrosine-type recombinase/integrase [Rhodospirillales bacterium]
MPTQKLTKRLIEGLKREPTDKFYWDTEIKGLGVKVTPKGSKSFLVQYRPGGRGTPIRKIRVGNCGSVSLHKARTEAARILGQKAEGRDPALERKQSRQKLVSDKFSSIVDDFLAMHASQNRTADETARILKQNVLPKWGKRSIHQIGKRDVNEVLDAVVNRGSMFMANRTLAALRKLFNWCVSRGVITASPCHGINAPHREKSRDRVLSDEELAAIFKTAQTMTGTFGFIIQVLVMTAQRRNEVANMEWSELDLPGSTWTIPAERTKNEKPHIVHLTDHAKALLKSISKIGDYVFTSNGKTAFSGFSKSKKRLDELSGVDDWRIHDIRRTVTSGMAKIRIAPHVADKILNHQSGTISGVAAVYQRHEYIDERQDALEAWGNYLQTVLGKTDLANVVDIRKS